MLSARTFNPVCREGCAARVDVPPTKFCSRGLSIPSAGRDVLRARCASSRGSSAELSIPSAGRDVLRVDAGHRCAHRPGFQSRLPGGMCVSPRRAPSGG